ncbi:MAG: right-handed parallel beta-helix repeat-containing protein [Planctomycetota bacterium]|nr:MAG: right-handed parallel beta-helix repeat-containing protein [Planctomycetota bacterium]
MNQEQYPLWADETVYRHTIVVAQQHPAADDDNPGNADLPLKSIQAAWRLVQPGQRIRVHAGIYREMLAPLRGGTGPQAMIALESAPGETVIVRGSQELTGGWSRPRVFDEAFIASGRTPSMSQRVWVVALPENITTAAYQPFTLRNVEPIEEPLMPWMEPVSGRPPFTLRRGLLLQDGQRLTQLHHHGDVPRVPGSFWVDDDGRSLLVHPIGGIHPDQARFELAVAPHLLCPQTVGLDYIRLSGIIFEHCANGFLRTGAAAVTTRGGGYWIIEDCHFQQINSAGLEFGDHPFEHHDPHPLNRGRKWHGQGHVVVCGNVFRECGTAGIRCLGTSHARVLRNTVHDCGWQDAEYYYECAGIKLLLTRHTLVAHNRISNLVGACGIWLDWDNIGSRVTGNVITDIVSLQGGIFIEASLHANRVDHNLIWGIDGPGIFGGDSSSQIYDNNLIGHTSAEAMSLYCHTDRSVNKQPVACVDNQVCRNLFVCVPHHRSDEENNTFSDNVYLSHRETAQCSWQSWQERGFDRDARFLRGHMQFDAAEYALSWQWDEAPTNMDHIGPMSVAAAQGRYHLTDLGPE